MQNDPAVPSSDLERARALSIRLTRARASSEEPEVHAPPVYARFSVPHASAPLAAPPALNFRALEGAGSGAWNEFLDWALAASDASGAFVVDQDGLPIAFRGGIDAPYLEAVGGRLSLAFDQASHLRAGHMRRESILIELDGHWLNGVRMPMELGGRLVLGLLTQAPLPVDLLQRVVSVLEAAFSP